MAIAWKRIIPRIGIPLIGLVAAGVYLIWSTQYYQLGFPLDDAWIHQTYAKNFAETLRWSYIRGVPSGGSTGPLWGFLLAIGHWLDFGPYISAYFWGYVFLVAIAILGSRFMEDNYPELSQYRLYLGLVLIFEWHLVWASVSGMETLLFSFLVLSSFYFLSSNKKNYVIAGGIAGLSTWVRPGGITLLGPLVLVAILEEKKLLRKGKNLASLFGGFLILFLPYLVFNLSVAGDIWPNTFYAKQAEYSILQETPFFQRVWQVGRQMMVGVGILIIPGFCTAIIKAFRQKKWVILAGAAWSAGYIVLYAWKLPVTYQHGRYIMPAIPMILILGMAEIIRWIIGDTKRTWKRIASRTLIGSIGLICLAFWLAGARAYARDVAVIESEMVTVAKWLGKNTEREAIVAAHDIGAIGYFSDRSLLDLAGLISPEVIPILRNQAQLRLYLDQKGADYLVTFPDWYPLLTENTEIVFQTDSPFSPLFGVENMAVYRWQR